MKIIMELVRSGDDEEAYDPLSDADRALLSDRTARTLNALAEWA
jgi:hypothetical protein